MKSCTPHFAYGPLERGPGGARGSTDPPDTEPPARLQVPWTSSMACEGLAISEWPSGSVSKVVRSVRFDCLF